MLFIEVLLNDFLKFFNTHRIAVITVTIAMLSGGIEFFNLAEDLILTLTVGE